LAAARRGCSVCVIEETDWLGGQFTSQGVAAFDEHAYIEAFGGTASYYQLRRAIRDIYRSAASKVPDDCPFNPGNCWVSSLAFEPAVAAAHIDKVVGASGRIVVYRRAKASAAVVDENRIMSVVVASLTGTRAWRFHPKYVLDATDLGDLLPLTGTEYQVGAETVRQTGEPHAQPLEARPECVQSYTYTFALERGALGESHVIPRPPQFERFLKNQPYSLTIQVHGGEIYGEESGWLSYTIFDKMPGTKGGLWTYRRLIDCSQFGNRFLADISMINWPGNDYRETSLIDGSPAQTAAALQAAKQSSLGFLYWLQTEAPASSGRNGAPELKLRADIMGSGDGLSKHPYIRESRRIEALKTVTEQELSVQCQKGPLAAHFDDSVGVGWYPIDIHPVAGELGLSCRTRPFQISLGSLIPVRMANLIAASKNIGTTHISNGCYRLHPVEWNIGESAGVLAAYAIKHSVLPRTIRHESTLLRAFQLELLRDGIPLAWLIDVPHTHSAFAAVQTLYMLKRFEIRADLRFEPDKPLSAEEWISWGGEPGAVPVSRAIGAQQFLEKYHASDSVLAL
jgi:FAD dependent oxidoreductase